MSRPRALENIRVVDFSWVRAGPWATRWLGAFGAEIIKIEWPENERGRLPSTTTPQNLEVNLNTSGNFNDTNVNKKSLSLNVRSAKGLEILKRLIAVSDSCRSGASAIGSSAKSNRISSMCQCQATAIQVGITTTPPSVLSPRRSQG